jgi:hypothetical protein
VESGDLGWPPYAELVGFKPGSLKLFPYPSIIVSAPSGGVLWEQRPKEAAWRRVRR